MSDHFVSEALYLTDPDGLGIEVYADRPRGDWRHDDRQLTMATIPLDVEAVLGAAGGERWSGDASPARCWGTCTCSWRIWSVRRRSIMPAWDSTRPSGVIPVPFSCRPAATITTSASTPGRRGAVPAGPDEARLLEWEVVVPSVRDAAEAIASIAATGGAVEHSADGGVARDPWGTAVRVRGVG